jgi:hypothetical protein
MKKAIFTLAGLLFILHTAWPQELGYTTTDIGAEYTHYSGGNIFNLHSGFNSRLHHSFLVRIGYNAVNEKYSDSYTNEKGGGITAGIGYRYYTSYKPHGFFIGAAADFWKMKIDWFAGNSGGSFKYSMIVPSAELGYMFLFNDMFFVTPSFKAGTAVKAGKAGAAVKEGFISFFGISTGVKF